MRQATHGRIQASAKKWLPELRKECDFLIVLACLPAREAVQLAVDNTTSTSSCLDSTPDERASGPDQPIDEFCMPRMKEKFWESCASQWLADEGGCAASKPHVDAQRQG